MVTSSIHPIVAQLTPSKEQRPAILARGCNVAVTAGAGAGKTRTLVARYLSLLADGLPLRSIVAITFTKKAAREMRNRIREEIRRYLEDSTLSQPERRQWQDHYQQLDGARIGTIHSLCAEILRHHPAVAGIDPRFGMLEEGDMALLQAQAIEATLAWAADTPDVAELFEVYEEQSLPSLIETLLQKRLDVDATQAKRLRIEAQSTHPETDPQREGLWATWKPILIAPIRTFLTDTKIQDDFAILRALQTDGSLARAEAAGDALVPDLKQALDHIDTLIAAERARDWEAASRHLTPLRESLKLKGAKRNWAPADPKATIRSLRERYDAMLGTTMSKGIDLALDHMLACEIIPALMCVYDETITHYTQAKQQMQALDFDDLEAAALQLLETSADARGYWQQEIGALLVDEFQDTNERQRDLLRALNGDAQRLFIVGDGKQSIYRFRGADVTVFRSERQTIATEGLEVELATSYRAHRDLVQGLNALLKPVLGVEPSSPPYVEPFSPLQPYRDAPASGLKPPFIELQLAIGSKSAGALDRAAQVLSARLTELVGSQSISLAVNNGGTGSRLGRPLNYGDIAILCRASTSFPTYENALEAAGIPYLTIAGRGFYDRPEVRDMINALTAIADPTDDLALTGLLRSPAMGLSDMALYRLRKLQQAENDGSLWSTLQHRDLALLENEAPQARTARELIQDLFRMVGRTPVADILKAFIDRTAYRAMLLRRGETRGANNINKLLDDTQKSGRVSIDAFLATLAELRDVAPREGEARTLATGAVQIMTIHQAKGLEFPVVVLGDAARGSYTPRDLLIDDVFGPLPPFSETRVSWTADGARQVDKLTSLAYQIAQEREKDQEAAESDRLLYVAATRVQELLIINGTISVRKNGTISLSGWLERLDSALHLAGDAGTDEGTAVPACDGEGDAVHALALDLEEHPVSCTIYEPNAPLPDATAFVGPQAPLVMPDDLQLLNEIACLDIGIDTETEEAERDPPRRVWRVAPDSKRRGAPSWVVGNLVHLALRDWAFPDDAERNFYRWAASEARNAGLIDEQRIGNAIQRAVRMLVRFQGTALYRAMTEADQRLTEIPYSVLDSDGRLNTGVIDALWRTDEAGRPCWHLVEFKTDRIQSPTALDKTLQETNYIEQVARYVAAATQLLGKPPEPTLCFLNYMGRVQMVTDRWS